MTLDPRAYVDGLPRKVTALKQIRVKIRATIRPYETNPPTAARASSSLRRFDSIRRRRLVSPRFSQFSFFFFFYANKNARGKLQSPLIVSIVFSVRDANKAVHKPVPFRRSRSDLHESREKKFTNTLIRRTHERAISATVKYCHAAQTESLVAAVLPPRSVRQHAPPLRGIRI